MDDIYNDPWHWHQTPRRQHQPQFGLGISSEDLQVLMSLPSHLQRQALQQRANKSPIGKDGFHLLVDVSHFQPNEISVKTIDNEVIIEGKHEEREDEHGYISRQFTRRYSLPKRYDPNTVTSTLSSEGILTVKAPNPPQESENNERAIEILHIGPVCLSDSNPKCENKDSDSKE